ncbi:MAG: hypothetical protein MJB14_09720 [Spirochaetes bacterium]|nr:hypothetical protein [Spirochaetota bacterium]
MIQDLQLDTNESSVIHFYQKVIDKTILKRFTADFILRIFGLFYRKNQEQVQAEQEKMIQSIQAALFSRLNESLKSISVTPSNLIEIKFDDDIAIPTITYHNEVEKYDNVLINVLFKKIGWEEINEFRYFILRFLQYYLSREYESQIIPEETIKKKVEEISYIIQELLQNANQYGLEEYDYQLKIIHLAHEIHIYVFNAASEKNYQKMKRIIEEIRNSKDREDLLLKFMLKDDKSLGLISSILNFNIQDYHVDFINESIIETHFTVALF